MASREEILGELRETFSEFTTFIAEVWPAIGLPEPTRRQYELAEYMQYGGEEIFAAAFRGIGKSFVAGAYGDFALFHDPGENVATLSASAEKADELSQFARALIENPHLPFLHFLRPGPGQRDNVARWDVGPAPTQQSPSWRSLGVEGQVQGGRTSKAILDDIETLANSKTPAARAVLLKQALDTESTKRTVPNAQSIWLGTFQSFESIYKQLKPRGFTCRFWPARYPKEEELPAYMGCLAPSLVKELRENPELAHSGFEGRGKPIDDRFTEQFLLKKEKILGPAQYQLQFQLNPELADRDRYPIRLDQLVVMDASPHEAPVEIIPGVGDECRLTSVPCAGHSADGYYAPLRVSNDTAPYDVKVMGIDPSGAGQDETAWSIVGACSGLGHLLSWGGRQDGHSTLTMETLAKEAAQYKVNEILIESNFAAGTWAELFKATLRKIYPCTITEVRAVGKKELRICDTIEPIVQAGKLVVSKKKIVSEFQRANQALEPEAAIARTLMYQLAFVSREPKSLTWDDRVDALELALRHIKAHIGMDMEEAARRSREEAHDKMLDKFLEGVWGSGSDEDVWVQVP